MGWNPIGIVLKDIMGNSAVFIAGEKAVIVSAVSIVIIGFIGILGLKLIRCLECSDWICCRALLGLP
ncbi:MAG: hypothetical protein ACLR2O_05450 [Coprococcus sp.]